MTAARQAQPVEGPLHEPLPRLVQQAVFPDHGGGHIGVAADGGAGKAALLDIPGGVDPLPDLGRRLGLLPAAHGLVLHRRHLDVHVDAVQQGAGNAAHVALHLAFRAGAAAGGVAVPPTAAGVHGAHQHEPAGQGQGPGYPGDGHHPILQRLAQSLQGGFVELRQLIQKEDAVVGQGDLPGPGHGAAAGQGHGRGRMVGAAEGPPGHQGVGRVRHPRHGVHLRGLQGLLPGHVRQDGRQPPGQHGLAGAGGADEQHIVAPGGGYLQGPLYVFLAHDVGKVRQGLGHRRGGPGGLGPDGRVTGKVGYQLGDVFHRIDGDPLGQGGLRGVLGRDKQLADAHPGGAQGHGQHPRHRTQRAGKAQLSQKRRVGGQGLQLLRCRQDAQQNGQVIHRPLLALARRGQVHGDAADGEFGPAGLDGGPDPLPGFPHRRVRQAHHVEGGQSPGQKALHRHLIAADAVES